MDPTQYPRRILMAVTGLSPQVVTETLYALAVKRQPAFVPTEVMLVTTAEGAERARLSLLSEEPGWFHRLLRDYGLSDVELGPERIQVLRDGLPERLLAGSASFGQTVCIAQRALEPPELVIDLAGQRIRAGGETVKLPAASLAFYSMMARRRQKGMHPARWDADGIDRQYLSEYRRVVSDMSGELERVEDALSEGMTKEYFDQRKSRTNSALERALGRQLAAPYLIQGDGRRPKTRFGLRIEPDAIRYGTVP